MKFLIFIFAVCSASAFSDYDEIIPNVVGGTESFWGQFPSSVIVTGPIEFCGGSVIDANHILTAASCVLNQRFEVINPVYWRVIAGDIFFTPASGRREVRNVSRIFVHENYIPFGGENNIAILRLNVPLPLPHNTIEAARRQTRIVRTGLQCQLVAFGRNQNATNIAFRTRQINLAQPIMDRNACEQALPHTNRLTETMICTQTAANAAPCSGSTGSGLYCNGFLTGVLSGGNFCNNTPAIYQQVRAFNQWIDRVIRNQTDIEQVLNPINMRGFPLPIAN